MAGEVANPKYFESPEKAVEMVTKLLNKKDWVALSRYYDLSDSNISRYELVSGRFFYTEQPPEGAVHPAGFWKYKHPFAPGFQYFGHEPAGGNRVTVTVTIQIDQGGGMVQRGMDSFKMIQTGEGYRILPDEASEGGE